MARHGCKELVCLGCAIHSNLVLFFIPASEPKISQGAPSYEDAVRGGAAEVGDFSEATETSATETAELPQRPVPGDQHLQSWQQLSQARMCHTVQRRFLSSLKNQSLRE